MELILLRHGKAEDSQATIIFCAQYVQEGKQQDHWEQSFFEKEGGDWKFLDAKGIQTGTTTVAGLPTCNAGTKGQRYFVTDANATTFHTTAAGGGANNMGVTCDGTNWYLS